MLTPLGLWGRPGRYLYLNPLPPFTHCDPCRLRFHPSTSTKPGARTGLCYKLAIFVNPSIVHLITFISAFVSCMANDVGIINALQITCAMVLLTMKSHSFLIKLLLKFPFSFSIGEAVLIIEGTLAFFCSVITNCIINNDDIKNSSTFPQVLLLGVGIFLLITSLKQEFQKLFPFTLIFLAIMVLLTFPLMFLVLKKNPIIWLVVDLIFSTTTRVLLIFYWAVCTVAALLIAWYFGGGSAPTKLTIMRKYFHGVVVAVYLPGVLLDSELLFTASVIALAAFLFLEAIRIYQIDGLGSLLNSSMAGFLDEKDQGSIILTHIYLLVGCSLPVWMFPRSVASSTEEVLLLCSGIISLGVGDSAASIGGSLFGRTKWPSSEKSLEGTACSIVAEMIFAVCLELGTFGNLNFPWVRYSSAAVVTSLVEAQTSQVDNLILPIVMYIILLI
nr:EOG090X0BFL [Eurycercus lamellatus]